MTTAFINKYSKYFTNWANLYNQETSHRVIARECDVPASAVYTYLREMGLTRIENVSLLKRGENNPKWKGDKVQVTALHAWVRRNYPKPDYCNSCKAVPPVDLANIKPAYNPTTYTRDLFNWEWLCRRCHMIKDGRLQELIKRNEAKRV